MSEKTSSPPSGVSSAPNVPYPTCKIVVMGPVSSGKTKLISTVMLSKEAENYAANAVSWIKNVNFVPPPGDQQALREAFARVQTQGPDSTSVINHREFKFELFTDEPDHASLGMEMPPPVALNVRVTDTPGGMSAPGMEQQSDFADIAEKEQELLAECSDADCIAICLSVGQDGALDGLQRKALENISNWYVGGELPKLKRVAVLLTKYESLFAEKGSGALKAAEGEDALVTAISKIGAGGIMEALKDISEKNDLRDGVDVRVFPVSVYGFLTTGHANCVFTDQSVGGRSMLKDVPLMWFHNAEFMVGPSHSVPLNPSGFDNGQMDNYWRPFNVIEPFIYLLTGAHKGLVQVAAPDLQNRLNALRTTGDTPG